MPEQITESILACPLCSVMPPAGSGHLSAAALSGHFRRPVIWHGPRSGLHWLHKPTGCAHGPALADPSQAPAELSGPWNEWARAAAGARADWLGVAGSRRLLWFYHVGVGGWAEVQAMAAQEK